MAADYTAYDAGTAYLTIQAELDKDFEAKLAAELSAIKALPVNIAPDLDQFISKLDKQWKDAAHTLPVQVEPVTHDQLTGGGSLEPLLITADPNLDEAEAKLREFFSLIPIYTIPAMLDTSVAEEQLAGLRAKAVEPVVIPVTTRTQSAASLPHLRSPFTPTCGW